MEGKLTVGLLLDHRDHHVGNTRDTADWTSARFWAWGGGFDSRACSLSGFAVAVALAVAVESYVYETSFQSASCHGQIVGLMRAVLLPVWRGFKTAMRDLGRAGPCTPVS